MKSGSVQLFKRTAPSLSLAVLKYQGPGISKKNNPEMNLDQSQAILSSTVVETPTTIWAKIEYLAASTTEGNFCLKLLIHNWTDQNVCAN